MLRMNHLLLGYRSIQVHTVSCKASIRENALSGEPSAQWSSSEFRLDALYVRNSSALKSSLIDLLPGVEGARPLDDFTSINANSRALLTRLSN